MGSVVPKISEKVFGSPTFERDAYFCDAAFVRADYQGKGVATAMFKLAFEEVRVHRLAFWYHCSHSSISRQRS